MRDLAYLEASVQRVSNSEGGHQRDYQPDGNLRAAKGTEYFFSDLHGEHEAFVHLLRSSSGIIREKIRETFGHLIPEEEEVQLANLIYYPDRNLGRIRNRSLHGRLAEDHHLPAGTDVQGGVLQIYPLQGPQENAEGVRLRDRRAAARGITTTTTNGFTTARSSIRSSRTRWRTSSSSPCAN